MTDERLIEPAPGRRVRRPDTAAVIPAAGVTVAWGSYWERLLIAGDIVVPAGADAPQSETDLGA